MRSTLLAGAVLAAVAMPAFGAGPRPPQLKSAAVLIFDRTTDDVLYERRADEAAPIASITKLMTALVVLEDGLPLDEPVTITAEDRELTAPNSSRLAVGTQLTRDGLLRLALMASENRAAQALARSHPQGVDGFVAAMNAKAQALGMTQTHFADPTGLSSDNRASPRDLVRLITAVEGNDLIRAYSTQPSDVVAVGRQQLVFNNTNPLVKDPGWRITLQKTGFIRAAGRCLVLEAQVEGRAVVMVLLNSVGRLTRVADARRVLRWIGALPDGTPPD